MLTDNELRELRNRKKREDALATSAGRIALNASKRRTPKEIAEMLKMCEEGAKPLKFPIDEETDPIKKALKAAGYID